jgi:tetratricopeptide (TPR) repeat protein
VPGLAERTLIFQVTPWYDLGVSRTIELRADQTLHDLHRAIQNAFGFDDDHAYAFFLNNRAWDGTFEYGGPEVESPHQADAARLGTLPLRKNKRFLYLFDFGDELRHEVRVVGEGAADAQGRYPRILGSVGAAPPQYPVLYKDEEGGTDHEEPPRLDPRLAELVPAVAGALERYDARRFNVGDAEARPAAQLREEAELAVALLDRSADSVETIHAVEHAAEGGVWGWLCDLPLELSLAGRAEEGLRLGERLHAILRHPPILFTVPLLLSLAGRPGEALDHLERNLAEYPDDPLMLLRAGEAFHALGDLSRAEEAYRDALRWVGDDTEARREIVSGLERVLRALGREDAVAELLDTERREQERRRQERPWAWQPPYRRQSPKVSRNASCPCGSGKKAKRCCGTERRT